MAFRKTQEVKDTSVNVSYLSTTEYVAGIADITTPNGGTSFEKRKIMYSDISGYLFDWDTGNQIVEVQYPYVSDLFKDTNSIYGDAADVYEENALMYKHECTEYYYGPSVYKSTDYYINSNDEYIPISLDYVEASDNEAIELIYDNGDRYTGKYQILLKRVYADDVNVNTDDSSYSISSHNGMTSYHMIVLLTSYVQNLYIRYTTGEVKEVTGSNGAYVPFNIINNYKEKIYLSEIYKYVKLEELETSTDKYVVSTVKTDTGYKIKTKASDILDKRDLDFFFWRISADFTGTDNIITPGKEIIHIGVIGNTVDSDLISFFEQNTKYKFNNPYPKDSDLQRWNIKDVISQAELNKYDIIIFRDPVFRYSTFAAKITNFISSGGSVLVDFNYVKPTIIESTLGLGPIKLNVTFSAPAATIYNIVSIDNYIFNSPSNYTITQAEADTIKTQCYTINVPEENYLAYNENNKAVIAKIKSGKSNNGGLFISTIGLTYKNKTNDIDRQMLLNFIANNIKIDTEISSLRKVSQSYTIKSPWIYSFVAGYNTDGTSILTEKELLKYNFFNSVGPAGNIVYKRYLSKDNAETIIKNTIVNAGFGQYLKNSSISNYLIEISGQDSSYVTGSISGNGMPVAYSNNVSSDCDLPDGYKWVEYEAQANDSISNPSNEYKYAKVKTMATISTSDSYKFSWNARLIAEKKVPTNKTIYSNITTDCDWLDSVRCESDDKWQARHGGYDYSDENLKNWKMTNAMWYPMDGHIWYMHSGSTGELVRYYQEALNQLKILGRHIPPGSSAIVPNLPLKVDGVFGTKTYQAVAGYQAAWGTLVDGVIDAGTASHIMRNIGHAIESDGNRSKIAKQFQTSWDNFGTPKRILDGNVSTYYGKRTWFNSNTSVMTDSLIIKLNTNINIDSLYLKPFTVNDKKIHLVKVESLLGTVWTPWINRSNSDAIPLSNLTQYNYKFAEKTSSQLRLTFFQDERMHSAYNNAKMWGFESVIFGGYASVSSTTYENVSCSYDNQEIEITYNNPTVFTFTPDEVKKLYGSFNGYVSTAANVEDYVKSTISAINTTKNCVVATTSNSRICVNLYDNAASVVSAKLVATGTEINIDNIYIDPNLTTRVYITSGVISGDLIEIEYYPQVDIDVDVTLNDTTGEVKVTFIMTEILEGSSTVAVWSSEWDASIANNQKYILDDGSHFPAALLTDMQEEELYDITLMPVITGGDIGLSAYIYDITTRERFSSLNASEFFLRKQNLRVMLTQESVVLVDQMVYGSTMYPLRYACKPYCLAWNFGEMTFGVKGLTGSTPETPWSLKVNSGIITKTINSSLLDEEDELNKDVTLVYNIGAATYSTSDGSPYVNITNEIADIIDIDTITLDYYPIKMNSTLAVTNEPLIKQYEYALFTEDISNRVPISAITTLQYSADGETGWTTYAKGGYGDSANWNVSYTDGRIYLITIPGGGSTNPYYWRFTGTLLKQNPSLSLNSYTDEAGVKTLAETLTIVSLDNSTGKVIFESGDSYDYLNGDRWIEATYIYRDEFVIYDGYVDSGSSKKYIFDVCPYDGHLIYNDISGAVEKTINNLGNSVYVYAMPNSVIGDSITIRTNYGIMHTFNKDIFDEDSSQYNPYALLISTIIMKQTIDTSGLVKIDTRRGGGGFKDVDKGRVLSKYTDESIWDFTEYDGNAYFIGGSIVITLPLTWKTYWINREIAYNGYTEYEANKVVEERALDIAKKYGAIGKHYFVVWDEAL